MRDLTSKEIYDLNNMNVSAQNPQLGDLLQDLIAGGGGGGGGGSSTEDPIDVSTNIGSYKNGDNIPSGTKFEDILRNILTTISVPILNPPSMSMSFSQPLIYKVGSVVPSSVVTISFDQGSINPAYGTNGKRAGEADNYRVHATGATSSYDKTQATNSFNVDELTRLTKGNIVITGTVNYAEGAQPKDSAGNNYSTPLPAGSISGTKTIEFIVPFYYGASSTQTITDLSGLVEDLAKKGNKEYTYDLANQYAVVAYDASYGNLKKIMDANGFDYTNDFSKERITVDGVDYLVYASPFAQTSSNFKYQYEF